jgi:hypothetical protein
MSPLLFIVIFVCVIVLCVSLTSYFVANAVQSNPTPAPPVPVGDGLECTFTHTLIPQLGYTSKLYIENDGSGVEINWGDGTVETVVPTPSGSGGVISHTYSSEPSGSVGPYTCTLKGATVYTLQFAKQNEETQEIISNIFVNSLNFTKAQNLRNLQAGFVFENSSIDISQCRRLTDLNLSGISVVNTGITSLDLSNFTNLLNCTITGFINFTSLTGVSGLTSLATLNVSGCTSLGSLNVSGLTALTTLNCNDCTSLGSLNVFGLTALTTLNCNDCTGLDQLDADNIVDDLYSNGQDRGLLSFLNVPAITNPGTGNWTELVDRGWDIRPDA